LQETTTDAFSRDTLSAGSPSVFQTAWSAAFASTPSGSTPGVFGIYLWFISSSQLSFQSSALNEKLNGPIYDTKAAETSASPTIVTLSSFNVTTF